MGKRFAGTLTISVDGVPISVEGSFELSLRTVEREGITGADGRGGYRETPINPFVEFDALMLADSATASEIEAWTDVTVFVDLASGRQAVLNHAWSSGGPSESPLDGKGSVRLECLPADMTEIAAA